MDTELKVPDVNNILDVNDFKDGNSKNVEIISDTIYKLALDSILCNKTQTLKSTFKALSKNFEKIGIHLKLKNKINLTCFYFGAISSITNLVLDIADDQVSKEELVNIAESYSLLMPALKHIKEHNIISGIDLRKKLDLHSSSSLSNFLKRIEKYELVNVQKIGTVNYISLSPRGEKLLSESNNKKSVSNETEISISEFYFSLDGLATELLNDNPSSIEFIHNFSPKKMNTGEKRLLKQKIDNIFEMRDKYIRSKFKSFNISPILLFEEFDDEPFNVYKTDIYEIEQSY